MSDVIYIPDPRPFWFIESELATDLLQAEIAKINRLSEEHPQLRGLFDASEATDSERKLCFALLARRKVLDVIYELFASRYEQSPALGDEESKALNVTNSLVASDAPDWVLEMDRVVDRLPAHLRDALPEYLRPEGYNSNDPVQMEALESAANTLNTVERLQTLIEEVLAQQFERLARRWTPPLASAAPVVSIIGSQKRKLTRTRAKQRMDRDRLIAEIDDISKGVPEFLKIMDERKVRPQPTWSGWPGLWTTAYTIPRLRKLIHQDKSRAIARVKRKK